MSTKPKIVHWHVFYRTAEMQEANERGFLRYDHFAESAYDALDVLLETYKDVLDARIYPVSAALSVQGEWIRSNVEEHTLPEAEEEE